MKPNILCAALWSLIWCACGAQAGMIHDPWLERFQVGQFRHPDRLVLDDGWPQGLLEPLAADPGWLAGAAAFFEGAKMPRGADQAAWRLVYPLLGDQDQAEAFHARARRRWQCIAALAGDRPASLEPDIDCGASLRAGFWARPIRMLDASRLWRAGEIGAALVVVEAMLRDGASLELSPAQVFVWSLRAAILAAMQAPAHQGGSVSADTLERRLEPVWQALHELGLYDTRSGWAVWVAMRRDRGRPLLRGVPADRRTGVMLATAGELWFDARALHAAGFAGDVEAGLGALLLPAADLAAHFERWATPPADGLFQGYWLRGQRRLRAGPDAIEQLAGLPGLFDGHRLDLWRRASEGYLLRGAWEAGLRTLEAGLVLMAGEASVAMQDRLRIWVVQALAFARAKELDAEAARIESLAGRYLEGNHASAFAEDAAPLLRTIPAGHALQTGSQELRKRHELPVLQAEVPAISHVAADRRIALPPVEAWRHELWESWAVWGLALLDASADAAHSATPAEYRRGLEAVLAAEDPPQRHATAVASAAGPLRGGAGAEALAVWALARDIELFSQGRALPHASPLPQLRAPATSSTLERQLHDHALLGAAIALGDDRGMLGMTYRLPAAGLDPLRRAMLQYPLPADPAVRAALERSAMPAELLLAVALNESLFEPAVRSRAGALGYMQIMPFHYEDPAGPPGPQHWRHPTASLEAGSRVLAEAVRRHRGDPYRSVAAYNAGSTAVERWDRQLGDVPEGAGGALYRAWISYPETRGYTLRVLRDREVYRTLLSRGL